MIVETQQELGDTVSKMKDAASVFINKMQGEWRWEPWHSTDLALNMLQLSAQISKSPRTLFSPLVVNAADLIVLHSFWCRSCHAMTTTLSPVLRPCSSHRDAQLLDSSFKYFHFEVRTSACKSQAHVVNSV